MYKTQAKRTYPSIVNAPYWRRIYAYIIDLIIILIIGLISFYAIDNIYSFSKYGTAKNEALYNARVDSGLYMRGDNLGATLLTEDILVYEEYYLQRIEYFYTNAASGFDYGESNYFVENEPFNYRVMVLQEGSELSLFSFDEKYSTVGYRYKDSLSANDVREAWSALYNRALNNLNASPTFIAANRAIKNFVSLNLTISAFIGTIFPWLIFPFLFGHGRSVGKFMTRLAVVNKDGFKVSTSQVIVRFLVFGIFETALNIYGFFIPLMITSGALAITKKNQAVHDLISKTYVIDARMSRIFNNAADEEAFYTSSPEQKAANKTFFTEAPLPGNLPLAK